MDARIEHTAQSEPSFEALLNHLLRVKTEHLHVR